MFSERSCAIFRVKLMGTAATKQQSLQKRANEMYPARKDTLKNQIMFLGFCLIVKLVEKFNTT